jgi:quinol monooxygenase YgiN
MPIHQIASYSVHPDGLAAVTAAITEFVDYVARNEPGTTMYTSWQQADDPTRFVHLFIFADEAAHRAHGESEAVAKFESVYRPFLAAGPVVFTDYVEIASNQGAAS